MLIIRLALSLHLKFFLFCSCFLAHISGAASPTGDDLSPELCTVAKVSLLLFQMVWDLTVSGSSAMLLLFFFLHEVSVFREYRIVSDRVWTELKSHHAPPDLHPVMVWPRPALV